MHKIVAHHVGARGFGVSLNLPAIFSSDIAHVLYEADAEAVKRMELETENSQAQMLSEKYVLPYCLGRKQERATLNLTRNAYASSLFSPNKEYYQYYCEIPIGSAVYDVNYEAMLEVVRQVEVEVQTLDELIATGKVPIARAPDFLSLDTQGFELEILHGAKKALSEGVLGMISEVEMLPMYSDQPLLGDILKFATDQGFIFAGFTAQFDVSPYRAPIGARGKAFPGFGDILLLRDIKTLTEDKFSVDKLYVMLRKLSFISVSFGHIEYAIAAANAAEKLKEKVSPSLMAQAVNHKYSEFLDEMKNVLNQTVELFPPVHAMPDDARPQGDMNTSWYNKYHQSAIDRYNETIGPTLAEQRAKSKEKMLHFRILRKLLRYLSYELVVPVTPRQVITVPGVNPLSLFEELLVKWGFSGPAEIVRQRRLMSEPYVRSLSPEMLEAGKYAHIPTE
jgi:FkbM family methyltransferase